MKFAKISLLLVVILSAVCIQTLPLEAQQTPILDQHIAAINRLFDQNGIPRGYVVLDRYGRVELTGEYGDEKEVDRGFSLAQTIVGVKWVSPVTPENIKVKEWERRLGGLFSRAKVLKPTVKGGDESPGPVRNRYAIVVGVGTFMHGIQSLQYSVRDATSFYAFLTDPVRGKFPKGNVIFMTDQNATRGNISAALDRIRNSAEADDLVVIYISTHGTPPDKFGGVHIVTYDTEVKPRERVWHTALTEIILKEFIENLRAKRLVMVLDTCYSNGAYRSVPGFLPPGGKSLGAGDEEGHGISKDYGKRILGAKDIVVEETPQKASSKSAIPETEGWGRVLVSASGAGEKSWESDSLRNSVFTYYLLDGLNRHDGSIKNAFFHAKPLVTQKVKEEKGADIDQNPQVMATGNNWDMRLSTRKN